MRQTPLDLGAESPPPSEGAFTEKLRELLRDKMTRDYPQGVMRRDAHPKHHGCVRAELTIEPGLSPELAVGLFAQPQTYQAWVRFSNQNGTVQRDAAGDIRGIAIKLLGVPGPKLLPGAETATTHDFILITTDRFVTKDVEEFHGLIAAIVAGGMNAGLFFLTHPRVAWNLWRSLETFGSVLEANYTSPTPYRLGSRAVRYAVRPVSSRKTPIPAQPSDDYLREVMAGVVRVPAVTVPLYKRGVVLCYVCQ